MLQLKQLHVLGTVRLAVGVTLKGRAGLQTAVGAQAERGLCIWFLGRQRRAQ